MKKIARLVPGFTSAGSVFGVSGGHERITRSQAVQLGLEHQWQDPALPEKQFAIVQKELADIRRTGEFPPHMKALIDQMRQVAHGRPRVLEIGCSSGYYSEVLALANIEVEYSGCDYSKAFIQKAQQLYPALPFSVEDNTLLQHPDRSYDIVISGCCLLHILNYPAAIRETARVAKRFMIFHRTPIIHCSKTLYTKKKGYGIDMVEIVFQEEEFIRTIAESGFLVRDIRTIDRGPSIPGIEEPSWIKNYLCMRYTTEAEYSVKYQAE